MPHFEMRRWAAHLLYRKSEVQLGIPSRHALHCRVDERAHVLDRIRRIRRHVRGRRLLVGRIDVDLRLLEAEEVAEPRGDWME